MKYAIVEREVIPDYVRRGFFMNKSLAPADFEVIECVQKLARQLAQ